MNIEHIRHSSGLVHVPNRLDEFDAETAGVTLPREHRAYGSGAITHSSLFAVVEAEVSPDPAEGLSPVVPKKAGRVIQAALVAGGLATGIGALIVGLDWWSSAPPALAARVAVAVDMVALSPPPALAAPAGESMHNVPPVYRKPSIPAARQAVTRLRITEIPGDVDIQTIKRALASLSSPNLPFEQCDVRVVAADRAMARCRDQLGDLSAWRVDFTRGRERWHLVPDEQ